jgi:hypothetical protein
VSSLHVGCLPLPLLSVNVDCQMESLRQAAQNKLNESERAKERLEADNVELYSKLRFHQGGGGNDPVCLYLDLSSQSVSFLSVSLRGPDEQDMISRRGQATPIFITNMNKS